jgi:hypothetical protein
VIEPEAETIQRLAEQLDDVTLDQIIEGGETLRHKCREDLAVWIAEGKTSVLELELMTRVNARVLKECADELARRDPVIRRALN